MSDEKTFVFDDIAEIRGGREFKCTLFHKANSANKFACYPLMWKQREQVRLLSADVETARTSSLVIR